MNNIQLMTPLSEEMKTMHEEHMRFLKGDPNNFSYWFPYIEKLRKQGIAVPKSLVIHISEKVYKAFFQERTEDQEIIGRWVKEKVMPVIENNDWLAKGKIFIKNGCFSDKFDFANGCLIEDPSNIVRLIRNICRIQYDAIMMDTSGYLQLVLREYIDPQAAAATIYNGMPLRPEARLFYDFNRHSLLYAVNYWDWDYCHKYICYSWGERTIDADTYESCYPQLEADTKRLLEKHLPQIEKALATVDTLTMPDGQPNVWSVDFMLEEKRVWLIDMAQGWRSAYWNTKKINDSVH